MSNIELVIKIPNETYQDVIKNGFIYDEDGEVISYAIKNGTLLPKGHGKLKDVDKIISDGISKGFCEWYDEMKYAPIIVEPDAESEE